MTAARIPHDRWGNERLRGLPDGERSFYRWILECFRAGTPPGPEDLAAAASERELEIEPTFELLAREDLVHRDPGTGAIGVAYPFSGNATAHRVRLASGHEVFAMCPIDALGIAPMVGERIGITSRDPLTGEEIHVELPPDGESDWQPREALVVCGASERGGASSSSCCPVLNFFASTENAARWLGLHAAVRGRAVSMEDAIAAGRIVFADLLKEE